ncbi:MAG: DUF2064 domain-containing protein [Solirubrobacterales bacterium]|nr:DUF2064 domain-containing protein [Solirubrobacterales bacterium]
MTAVIVAEPAVAAPGCAANLLEPLLGARRAAALAAELWRRARAWAAEIGGGSVLCLPACGAAALEAAVEDGFAAGHDAVLIASPWLPRWRPEHGRDALEDLAGGAGLTVGPLFDGGFYLVGLAAPAPGLPGRLVVGDRRNPFELAAAIATEVGLVLGMLRAERGLRTAADVRALLADPLTDADLRRRLV